MDLQSSGSSMLDQVNEMLAGKRLSESQLISLMTESLGMQSYFAKEVVSDARMGLEATVQRETTRLSQQFKNVLGADLDSQSLTNSIKVMQKLLMLKTLL